MLFKRTSIDLLDIFILTRLSLESLFCTHKRFYVEFRFLFFTKEFTEYRRSYRVPFLIHGGSLGFRCLYALLPFSTFFIEIALATCIQVSLKTNTCSFFIKLGENVNDILIY